MSRMSFEELIECKHPTAWIEFEKGIIDEVYLELCLLRLLLSLTYGWRVPSPSASENEYMVSLPVLNFSVVNFEQKNVIFIW